VVSSNNISCTVPTSTLTATVVGDVPIDAGILIDDQYPPLPTPIGFTFNFYGTPYTSCLIGPNGTICFNTSLAGAGVAWSIPATFLGTSAVFNSICGPWCDVDITWGGTIKYSTDGVAPNRKLVVTFCATHMFSCTTEWLTTQMILYEGSNNIEVHLGHRTICASGWNGSKAVIGVQNATGTAATVAPGRDVSPTWTAINEGWRFIPAPGGGSYTVGSIPYAPIPYVPTAVYWYDLAGTYIGSTPAFTVSPTVATATLTVSPTVTTTYKACALGCADTSFAFVTVTVAPLLIVTGTFTNPTYCGNFDGTITLSGLAPGSIDTINYSKNGVPQSTVITTVSAAGTITLTGLGAGSYTGITVKQGSCVSTALSETLTNPVPPPGRIVDFVNPTECGFFNGSITLKGVPPFSSDTVNYSRDGIPQPVVVTTALSDSTVFLPGLGKGTYSGFSVKIGDCVYAITGSVTLVDSPLHARFTSSIGLGCKGDSVFFSNLSTSVGPLYYIWKFGDGTTDTVANPTHVYAQGSYTVTLYATNHFCVDSAKNTYVFDHPLNAAFTASPMIVCQGMPVTFTNASVGNGATYQWSFGTGATSTGTDPVYTFANTGQYDVQLIVTDTIPCKDTAHVQVVVDTMSGVQIGLSDSVLCQGTYVTFTASFAALGNTGISWHFSNGDSVLNVNPLVHAFNTANTYTISVTPHYRACKDTTAFKVVNVLPQPGISIGGDTSICAGSETITLKDDLNAGNPAASWRWSNGSTSSSAIIVAPGIYFATVNINNCYASDTITVLPDCYMNIPNVFTPNSDGINDYFYPRSLLSRGLKTFHMNIYNRWGQLIFETSSLEGAGWDGKMNGVLQPEGVYVYIIDAAFRDGQKEHHQGNVTLLK
jgi:gliding motility-associated-like protein